MPVAVHFIQKDSLFKGYCTNIFMQELVCESAGVVRALTNFQRMSSYINVKGVFLDFVKIYELDR